MTRKGTEVGLRPGLHAEEVGDELVVLDAGEQVVYRLDEDQAAALRAVAPDVEGPVPDRLLGALDQLLEAGIVGPLRRDRSPHRPRRRRRRGAAGVAFLVLPSAAAAAAAVAVAAVVVVVVVPPCPARPRSSAPAPALDAVDLSFTLCPTAGRRSPTTSGPATVAPRGRPSARRSRPARPRSTASPRRASCTCAP
ncbi:MAG: hypothetical protein R2702_11205 [Acidimicrobiales bacterium]